MPWSEWKWIFPEILGWRNPLSDCFSPVIVGYSLSLCLLFTPTLFSSLLYDRSVGTVGNKLHSVISIATYTLSQALLCFGLSSFKKTSPLSMINSSWSEKNFLKTHQSSSKKGFYRARDIVLTGSSTQDQALRSLWRHDSGSQLPSKWRLGGRPPNNLNLIKERRGSQAGKNKEPRYSKAEERRERGKSFHFQC